MPTSITAPSAFLHPVYSLLFGEDRADIAALHTPTIAIVFAVLLLFQLIDVFSGGSLHALGLRPRDFPIGFVGLLVSPLVSASFSMFFFNALPFYISFHYLLARGGTNLLLVLTCIGSGIGGILTWIMARQASHFCGLGPLICTYCFYLLPSIYYTGDKRETAIGVLCYSAMVVFTVLFSMEPRMVSWEGYVLCSLLGGGFRLYSISSEIPNDVVWNKVPNDVVCEEEDEADLLEDDLSDGEVKGPDSL
ncbi:hypothetical protein AAMO2058_000748700 [Amorphochlora amoebiformis]|mmetsp:Transcript_18994/g.30207  ORF Transcript_18994/g.30207 Transcript_18994/m.30207 type:complete len:249 (-) Transcript_18994:243-989(-)